MPAALDGSLTLDELLTDHFLRELHTRLYGPIWQWGGRQRQFEVNIGIAPEQIAVELHDTLGTIAYRWEHTDDWTPRQLGIVARAETVRIHPFVDGNGRTTRLLADLVFAAAQNPTEQRYDWDLDKTQYIHLLRAYDIHRDITDLAAFIGVEPIEPPRGMNDPHRTDEARTFGVYKHPSQFDTGPAVCRDCAA